MSDNPSNYEKVHNAALRWQTTQGMVPLRGLMSLPINASEDDMRQYLEALPDFGWLDEKKTVGNFAGMKRNFAASHAFYVIDMLGKEKAFEGAISAKELHSAYCSRAQASADRKILITSDELLHFIKTAFDSKIGVDLDEGHVFFLNPEAEQDEARKVASLTERLRLSL